MMCSKMCVLPKASLSQLKTSLNWKSLPFVLLTPNCFGYLRNEGAALVWPLMPSCHFFQSCGMRKMWPSFYNTEDLVAFPIWFGNQTLPWMRSLLFCVAAKWSVGSSRRWLLTIMTVSPRVGPPPPILATYNVGDTRRALPTHPSL